MFSRQSTAPHFSRILISALIIIFPLFFSAGAVSGKSFRIAYFEAGDYPLHRSLQLEVRERLEKITPDDMEIIYAVDGYKSAEWDREACKRMAREIVADRKIDLVMAMGPWTVEDLLAAGCKKPIVAMGRFDPTLEGLAGADGKPKKKNLTVRLRPAKVETELSVLQAVYPEAKRIGIMYFPSANESGIVERFFTQKAERLGMTIVSAPQDLGEVNYHFFKKIPDLIGRVDALYMTPLYGISLQQTAGFFAELHRANIPVFSSEGFEQLERGAFATNVSFAAAGAARFHADKIIKILRGATPNSLPTVFREGRRLGINLSACDRAGIVPAPHLLAEARLIERTPGPSTPLFTVDAAIAEARNVNPGVLAGADALSAAHSASKARQRDLYPHLSASAYLNQYDVEPPENALRARTEGKSGYDLTLTQTLFDWGAFKSSALSSSEMAVSDTKRADALRRMEFAIAAEYLALDAAQQRAMATTQGRENVHRALQIALVGFLLDEVDRSDLLRWEARKDQLSVETSRAREEVARREIAFLSLLGRTVSEPFTIDKSLYSSESYEWRYQRPEYLRDQAQREKALEFWLGSALGQSAELLVARKELDGARVELSAQSGAFLPRVEGFAGYFRDDQFAISSPLAEDEQGWIVGARISASLFDGGRAFKERARLKYELSRHEYLVDQALVETSASVRSAFTAYLGAYDRTQFAARRAQLTGETLEGVYSDYELNKITLPEMADELEQALSARLDLINAVYDFHNAKHQLYFSAGYGYLAPRGAEEVALFERIKAFVEN